MKPAWIQLREHLNQRPMRAIGLMSGTSTDAIDAALIDLGLDEPPYVRILATGETPIDAHLRKRIHQAFDPHQSSVDLICQLNVELGEAFAASATALLHESNTDPASVDCIGSHGQTVYHIPRIDTSRNWQTRSTLQLGEPAIIAERTGIQTVSDFRQRDMAAGGVGAPLIPFIDAFLFSQPERSLVSQNLGGIANSTVIPASGDIFAFDSGPANMVMDLLVQRFVPEQRYDTSGALAANGAVNHSVVEEAMQHPYFSRKPPKATGHEDFGTAYVDWLVSRMPDATLEDRIATACEISAHSLGDAFRRFIEPQTAPGEVIVAGGGALNPVFMQRIREHTPAWAWTPIDAYGIPASAKEAIGFAILGAATLLNIPANVPSVTGATKPVVMGTVVHGK